MHYHEVTRESFTQTATHTILAFEGSSGGGLPGAWSRHAGSGAFCLSRRRPAASYQQHHSDIRRVSSTVSTTEQLTGAGSPEVLQNPKAGIWWLGNWQLTCVVPAGPVI
jgi:hypothetical protein